ncbi:MAG TPA: hypothetical protein VFM29_06785 [Vicinamibacteria bacterium]|nr:hypothetical protein [Vicinamibacteria bacterium]
MAGGAAPVAAALGLDPRSRALSRRFLGPREGTWHDGDENLVRGWLDRWRRPGEPLAVRAGVLVEAADALAAMHARPEALWFYLWALEGALASIAAEGNAD